MRKYLTGGIGVILILLVVFMLSKCNTCKSAKTPVVANAVAGHKA
ncbi:hypothetical protein [Ferruginibacter lapsinanis]|nr:hypothetical protein [Ferruginibacter lapsinanis]